MFATLAVSNIFGNNCFNMLVVAAADVGCPGGDGRTDSDTLRLQREKPRGETMNQSAPFYQFTGRLGLPMVPMGLAPEPGE